MKERRRHHCEGTTCPRRGVLAFSTMSASRYVSVSPLSSKKFSLCESGKSSRLGYSGHLDHPNSSRSLMLGSSRHLFRPPEDTITRVETATVSPTLKKLSGHPSSTFIIPKSRRISDVIHRRRENACLSIASFTVRLQPISPYLLSQRAYSSASFELSHPVTCPAPI